MFADTRQLGMCECIIASNSRFRVYFFIYIFISLIQNYTGDHMPIVRYVFFFNLISNIRMILSSRHEIYTRIPSPNFKARREGWEGELRSDQSQMSIVYIPCLSFAAYLHSVNIELVFFLVCSPVCRAPFPLLVFSPFFLLLHVSTLFVSSSSSSLSLSLCFQHEL